MKKTLNINLNGIVFNIDEDAFNMLSDYLDNLRHVFEHNGDDADEIVNDIEGRICELLSEKISDERQVVTINHIEEIISRKFLKEDRLEVSINANQFLTPYVDYVTITETDAFRSEQVFRNKQWKVGISISYRLGGLKQDVKKASKSIINDDLIKSESSGTL